MGYETTRETAQIMGGNDHPGDRGRVFFVTTRKALVAHRCNFIDREI